jgi:hypothetical protein
MMRFRKAVPLACVLMVMSPAAIAAQCRGIDMPERVTVGGQSLTLNGMGLRKATIFSVKVYVAGLYLAASSGDASAIMSADQPRHLVLRFVRDVDVGDIREAWQEGFEKNAAAKLAGLQARIDTMKAYMVDFEEGHSLTFSYRPAAGTAVLVNGEDKGTIEGADFASALIAIWLAEPPNLDLKRGLLGGACG